MKSLGLLLTLLLSSSLAFAGAAVTYHGRILDSNEQPVESPNVTFKIQIRSPGATDCLLYEETRTVDMRNSAGVFVVPIADGSAHRTSGDPGLLIENVFSNNTALDHTGLACNSGGHYQPQALDSRKLVVIFNDGSGSGDQILPAMDVNYVPLALHATEAASALKIGTVAASQVMSVSSGAATPLSAANFAELLLLVNGNSSAYLKPASIPTCASGQVLKGTAGAFVCVTDASGTDTLAGISCADGKILKRMAGSWACADESGVGTESDPTVQPFAKKTVGTGLVVDGSDHVGADFGSGAGKVVQGNDSRLTDSRAPVGAATGDLSASYPNPTVAKIRGVDVDTTAPLSGQVLKYDGTKWAPASDSGVVSELDPSVQSFAKNPVGSGLTVSSSQVTADFGTTAGKIAQGNDSRFTDSRTPNGPATGDLAGSYPNPSVKAIRGNAVATTTPLNGQVYQWVNGSTEWQPKYLSFADLKKSDGTTQMPTTCAANQTLAWSSITDVFACADIGSLDASKITAGTIAYARLPVGTAASTIAAGDDSRFGNATKISGVAINIAALTTGQVLKYDGTNWVNGVTAGETDPSVAAYAKRAPGTGLTVNGSNDIVPDFGTGAGKVVQGNDSRLTDNRVASDLNGVVSTGIIQRTGAGSFSTLGVAAPITNSGTNIGLTVGTGLTLNTGALVPDFGSASGKIAQGNDSRFPSSTCGSGNASRWDGSAWQCEPAGSTDSTKVLKTGDTMSGTLTLPANGLVVGTTQLNVNGGNVGIGIASASEHLHVYSAASQNVMIEGPATANNALGFKEAGTYKGYMQWIGSGSGVSGRSGNLEIETVAAAGNIDFRPGQVSRLFMNATTGNIGIGTSSPAASLGIKGTFKVDGQSMPVAATGGTVTTSGAYTVHTFNSSGTFTATQPGYVEVLVVAGGGGGGGPTYHAGGGGGGGVLYSSSFYVGAQAYTVTIGAGGAAGTGTGIGGNGGNSTFATFTSIGGGGGGNYMSAQAPTSGGSGGGGPAYYQGSGIPGPGAAGTPGQGYAGGNGGGAGTYYGAGGGGGAGGVGGTGTSTTGGNGGIGLQFSISGTATYYGGGGGGSTYSAGTPGTGGLGGGGAGSIGNGTNGTANTGGGGGAGERNGSTGGAGGSGIVIIRYVTAGSTVAAIATDSAGNVDMGGRLTRGIQHAIGINGDDGTDNGPLAARVLTFTKLKSSSDIRIGYSDVFRVTGSAHACYWEIKVDGSSCSTPLRYNFYEGTSGADQHSPRSVFGYCSGIGAGSHTIQIYVTNSGYGGGYGSSDCYTGWNGSTWALEAEETN